MALFPMLGLGQGSSFGSLLHGPKSPSLPAFSAGSASLGSFSFFGVRVSLASLHSRTVAPEPCRVVSARFPAVQATCKHNLSLSSKITTT